MAAMASSAMPARLARAVEIHVPLLVLHGEADMINSVEGSKELFNLASSADKQLLVYPGGYHEPHNDLDRDKVVSDVIEWIAARTPAIPSYIAR